jgi:hypothetical protein
MTDTTGPVSLPTGPVSVPTDPVWLITGAARGMGVDLPDTVEMRIALP